MFNNSHERYESYLDDYGGYDDFDLDYENDYYDDYFDSEAFEYCGHYLVCNLRIKNIPDDMDAYQLYEILKEKRHLQSIIDVKIQQRESKLYEDFEEQIKQENYFSSMIRSLEQDPEFNGGQNLDHLFTKLDQEGKCFSLKFDENDPHNFHKKLDQKSFSNQIKNSTYLRPGLEFTDCDNFITDLWNLSAGGGIKEKYSNKKGRYGREKKKSAIVSVLGYTKILKSRYDGAIIENEEKTYKLYLSYFGGKKGVGLSKSLQYKKVQHKEKIECTNIEFGVFDPKNPNKFCRDLEISK